MPFNNKYNSSELALGTLGRVLNITYENKNKQQVRRFNYLGEIYGVKTEQGWLGENTQQKQEEKSASLTEYSIDIIGDFTLVERDDSFSSIRSDNSVASVDSVQLSGQSKSFAIASNPNNDKSSDISDIKEEKLLCVILYDEAKKCHIAYFMPCDDKKHITKLMVGQQQLIDVLAALKKSTIAKSAIESLSDETLLKVFKSNCQHWIIPLSQDDHRITLDIQVKKNNTVNPLFTLFNKTEIFNIVPCFYDSLPNMVTFTKRKVLRYKSETKHLQEIITTFQDVLITHFHKTNILPVERHNLGLQINDKDCGLHQLRVATSLIQDEKPKQKPLNDTARLYDELMYRRALVSPLLEAVRKYFNLAPTNAAFTPIPATRDDIKRYLNMLITYITEKVNNQLTSSQKITFSQGTVDRISLNTNMLAFLKSVEMILAAINMQTGKNNWPEHVQQRFITMITDALTQVINDAKLFPAQKHEKADEITDDIKLEDGFMFNTI
ncbi:MAG: hypothetical protein ACK4PR_04680 [Gammaproteobacteria bacterium]